MSDSSLTLWGTLMQAAPHCERRRMWQPYPCLVITIEKFLARTAMYITAPSRYRCEVNPNACARPTVRELTYVVPNNLSIW